MVTVRVRVGVRARVRVRGSRGPPPAERSEVLSHVSAADVERSSMRASIAPPRSCRVSRRVTRRVSRRVSRRMTRRVTRRALRARS